MIAIATGTSYFATAKALCLSGGVCDTGLPKAAASSATLHDLLQILFAIFGGVAVLMIVIAGLNFINAQGDPAKVAKARNSIIFALIGLVVAISAEMLVALLLRGFAS